MNPPSSQSGSHNFDLILNFILHQNKNEPAFSGRSKIEKLGSWNLDLFATLTKCSYLFLLGRHQKAICAWCLLGIGKKDLTLNLQLELMMIVVDVVNDPAVAMEGANHESKCSHSFELTSGAGVPINFWAHCLNFLALPFRMLRMILRCVILC